jgi:site-specific recombinase XerD
MEGLSKTASTILGRINSDPLMLQANKKHIADLIQFLQARGAKPLTVDKYVYHYEKILKALGQRKDLLKASRGDLERVVAKINTLGLADEEKRKIRVTLKVFYKHFLGEDLYYPKQVAWMKTSGAKNKMLPEDLLSEAEVLKLIETAKDLRDKAIIALLFDTGMRIGELASLRIKDVEIGGTISHIMANGKTGMRRIPITFSVPYLSQYLNTMPNAKSGDNLWQTIGTWEYTGKTVRSDGIRQMLKRLARKAGINKRIYPHLFRHSRASIYANKLTEQQLKVYFGWTGDSKMAATYVHLSGRDIDNAIIHAYGGKPDVAAEEVKLKVKVCARCQFDNPVDAKYCNRCGSPLDISTAVLEEKTSIEIRNSLMESIKDPKLLEEIVHQYLLEKKKKGSNR